jgi:hypothetical protein
VRHLKNGDDFQRLSPQQNQKLKSLYQNVTEAFQNATTSTPLREMAKEREKGFRDQI